MKAAIERTGVRRRWAWFNDEQFDALVRDVYKVLLTRGMVGTVLYSTDAETRDALRRLVR